MRLALAIAAAAAAQLAIYLRFAAAAGVPVIVLAYIVLATSGAGFFAAGRGAFAGGASVVVAATCYALLTFLGAAGTGMSAADIAGEVVGLVATFIPYIAIGAIAGALGGALRSRLVAR